MVLCPDNDPNAAPQLGRAAPTRGVTTVDMDRFDGLTKALVSGISRRRLLAGLLGGAIPVLLGTRPVAADDNKRNGKKCTKNAQCASGHCCGATLAAFGVCQACCRDTAIPNGACDAPDPGCVSCGAGAGKDSLGTSSLCCSSPNPDQPLNCRKTLGEGGVIQAFCWEAPALP